MKYYFRSTICEILSQNKKKKKKGKGIGGKNSEDGSNPLPSDFAHFATFATVSRKKKRRQHAVCVCVCLTGMLVSSLQLFLFSVKKKTRDTMKGSQRREGSSGSGGGGGGSA